MAIIKIENLSESEGEGTSVLCSKKVEMGVKERLFHRHLLKPGQSAFMGVNASDDPDAADRSVVITQKDNIFE